MKQLLLIDGEPLKYRALFSKGEAYVCEGIIHYFFSILEQFPASDALLFWDEGKSRWRSEYYPEYKANRQARKEEFNQEEITAQKKRARQFLSHYGVRDIVVPGVEADDFIALFSEYFSKYDSSYDRIIIVSRDHDLWQLINHKVVVYDALSNVLVDGAVVENELGISPGLIADLKAMVGDTSDNIKGVKGVGEVTAGKLLKQYGDISEILSLENVKELKKKKITSRIVNNAEELETSYQLVKLPTLHEAHAYLNDEELSNFQQELTKPIQVDTMMVQLESEMMGLAHKVAKRYFSSLENEIQGLLYWVSWDKTVKASEASQIDAQIIECNRCPLRSESGLDPVYPVGNFASDIMVVGRDPSLDKVFVEKLMEDLEIGMNRVWMTYVCKCHCKKPPTYGEIKSCSGHLKNEIAVQNPRLIIALGNEAMSLTTPNRSDIVEHCGEILEVDDRYVCMLIGPDSVKRSEARKIDYEFGVNKLKEFLEEKRK